MYLSNQERSVLISTYFSVSLSLYYSLQLLSTLVGVQSDRHGDVDWIGRDEENRLAGVRTIYNKLGLINSETEIQFNNFSTI